MYLLCIHVPVYRDADRTFVTTEWARSVILLRNSLEGRYGELMVVAPERDLKKGSEQELVDTKSLGDDVSFEGAFDGACRPRKYWLQERSKWVDAVRRHASVASVIHTGLNDLYRPINLDALRVAVAAPAPVVFARDTDEVQKALDLSRGQGALRRLKVHAYNRAYDAAMRWAVSHADLSLLKGKSLMDRYARFAKNPHTFHDTSYCLADVIEEADLEARLANRDGPLRLVYCGRMEHRKGVDEGIRAVAHARTLGANVTFDIIGDGKERETLVELVRELGVGNAVAFLGRMAYGPELHERLRKYDALFFTPKGEDTPRMIFDAYAAGLPLLGYEIAYTKERRDEEEAAVLAPLGDFRAAGELLSRLAGDSDAISELSRKARKAGVHHSVEHWYKRRAEWTFAIAPPH
jgi:glycosyltransferase involved in cell wall biosynthesis